MTTKRIRISMDEAEAAAAVSSHFRLFDLPFDLREYITRFVDRKTAARLLTLSSGCHELFARCVWLYIDEKVFDSRISKKARKRAFTRYGRLVRCVDIRLPLDGLDYSIDLSQLLPNVTVYAFEIGGYGSEKRTPHLINAVSGFHGLRSLKSSAESELAASPETQT
ncbi:hypothetical protein GQ42DRAFT_177305 [Ramicandelaber brevisporus]|nr:hypothetical protein GQ42DRAFT_177305 [Ramicandelaber brevisporus]